MFFFLKSFYRENEATVAVEFAILAIPFFLMIIGTVEVGLFYASSILLEGSVQIAGRIVRTGQAQADPESAFKEKLCTMVEALLPCADLKYEAIKMPNNAFADAENYKPQFNSDGDLISSGFNAGSADDVILIRVAYTYHFVTPFIGKLVTSDSGEDGKVPLLSTVIIKNEPYSFG